MYQCKQRQTSSTVKKVTCPITQVWPQFQGIMEYSDMILSSINKQQRACYNCRKEKRNTTNLKARNWIASISIPRFPPFNLSSAVKTQFYSVRIWITCDILKELSDCILHEVRLIFKRNVE